MSFTSASFLLLTALCVVLYYALPKRCGWAVLLVSSMAFYAACGARALAWLLGVVLVTWLGGLALGKLSEKKKKKAKKGIVAAVCLLCFGLLFAMKYLDYVLQTLGTGRSVGLIMPLGLSFFTFQSVSYVIDVYRGKTVPEKNPLKYLLFVSFFPQMVQGPIGRYGALAPQLTAGPTLDWRSVKFGIELAMWGYFKKLVIADRAAVLVNNVIKENTPYGGAVIAFGILTYCVQLYCDFSGGIDISRGVAQMMGIEMAENFRRPIFATSLADYWRRWHITLGGWMRDYVFYPISLSKPFVKLGKWARKHLGGLPGKMLATSLATFIVYLIIGIWHGSSLKYIAFGLWNGAIITASLLLEKRFGVWKEKLHIDDKSAGWRIFQTLRTACLVFIGRYLTKAPRLLTALSLLKTTVFRPVPSQLIDGTILKLGLSAKDLIIIGAGTVVILFLEFLQERGVKLRESLEKQSAFVQWLTIFIPLVVLLLLGVFRGSYISSEFIYKQF